MDTTTEEKEKLIGFEIMRLMQLTRDETIDNLLSAALAGREQTVASVSKLWNFVLRFFGSDVTGNTPSRVAAKYWVAVASFLDDAGLTKQQIENIHSPFARPGDPNFISVLKEMSEEGRT